MKNINNLTDLISICPQTDVSLKMDYKLILESQYLTNRICEIAGRPLEIGFIYGGTVQTHQTELNSHTTIDMKQIAVPQNQYVTPTTFKFDRNTLPIVDNIFQMQNYEIVGQGHSHQNMDVFHSGEDKDNYKRMTLQCGVQINPHEKQTVVKEKRKYSSLSKRVGAVVEKVKEIYKEKEQKPTYVFPSLVFNTQGDITQGLAVNDITHFAVKEDVPIQYYNKQAVLTADDKKRLDKDIYVILKHNNLPFEYENQSLVKMNRMFENIT